MKLRIIVLLSFFMSNLSAQTQFTTVPQYPSQTDSIVITFDVTNATHSNKIAGYNGDVYAHTGVSLRYSDGSILIWQNVIGAWGNNSTQPRLVRIADNTYRITINNPRKFYNVNDPSVDIVQLCFVLRSSDGTKQTEDVFVPLYEPGITVVINSPDVRALYGDPLRSPYFTENYNPVLIRAKSAAIGAKAAMMKLLINSETVSVVYTDTLSYLFTPDKSSETNYIEIIAEDTTGISDTAEFVIVAVPQQVDEPLPGNFEHGINYNGNEVYLVLFAPYKKFVYLIGDFNDWKVNSEYLLKRYEAREDSVLYWIKLDNLQPGTEYAFQYLIDGKIRIPDPYSEKILDPWNDSYITSSVYPDLISYPYGKTENIVSVLSATRKEYVWKTTDFEKPPKENLVIYEMLVRDFVETHDFAALIDTIGYFKKLGVNAIELMPVMEFEGNSSWGYNPMMHFAVDKYYGPADKLKEFVDSCHSSGIAVILDIVLNHAYGLNPLVRMYWDTTQGRPASNNPWFNQTSPNQVFSWGYDFNHESNNTKYYVDRVTSYWLKEFKADGFRFDFSKGFTNTPGDGGSYDPSRIKILKRMADKLWETDPEAYVILEHFAPDTEEKELASYGMMLWGNLNYNYSEAAMGWNEEGKSDFGRISYKSRGFTTPALVGYMESHDEERLMYKNLTWGNSNGDYDVKELSTALDRIKLAAVFFITVPGPKMLWQFEELGYDYSIDYNGRLGEKPIRWDYYTLPEHSDRQKLFEFFSELINLKKTYGAFSTDNFVLNVSDPIKEITLVDSSMNVKIIGNFGVASGSAYPQFPNNGYWYEYFTGDSIKVDNGTTFIKLKAGEYKLYTSVRISTRKDSSSENGNNEIKENFYVYQNHPNPFSSVTLLEWELPQKSSVVIKLFNPLGEEISDLVNEIQEAGNHKYYLKANKFNLPSGIYFVNYNLNGFIKTQKIVLIK